MVPCTTTDRAGVRATQAADGTQPGYDAASVSVHTALGVARSTMTASTCSVGWPPIVWPATTNTAHTPNATVRCSSTRRRWDVIVLFIGRGNIRHPHASVVGSTRKEPVALCRSAPRHGTRPTPTNVRGMGALKDSYDVVVVGGGHNGLTAAAYLARAGVSVLVLERLDHVGGAAVSAEAFPGTGARLSRYSYLVSLLPDRIVRDLDLDIELRSRATASYSPTVRSGRPVGLFVEHDEGTPTRESFRALTGGDREYDAWRAFYADVAKVAAKV